MTTKFQLTAAAIVILFLLLLRTPAYGVDGCPVEPCISATSWAATPTPKIAPPPLPVSYVYLPVVR
jgi:hypothetical protein